MKNIKSNNVGVQRKGERERERGGGGGGGGKVLKQLLQQPKLWVVGKCK